MMPNHAKLTALAAVAVVALAGCKDQPTSTQADQRSTDSQLQRYQANQPIPASDWSQYRQTVIDVELAQIHGVTTTSFFFNLGVPAPIEVCPSIGFPVPTTAQLTNPDQVTWGANNAGAAVIAQAEPNGAYTGASSGTYVVCVGVDGTRRIDYWEGDVHTVGGAAHWDKAAGQIVLDKATVTSQSHR